MEAISATSQTLKSKKETTRNSFNKDIFLNHSVLRVPRCRTLMKDAASPYYRPRLDPFLAFSTTYSHFALAYMEVS